MGKKTLRSQLCHALHKCGEIWKRVCVTPLFVLERRAMRALGTSHKLSSEQKVPILFQKIK